MAAVPERHPNARASCDINGVRAVFENDALQITFPQLATATIDERSATAARAGAAVGKEQAEKAENASSQKKMSLSKPRDGRRSEEGTEQLGRG